MFERTQIHHGLHLFLAIITCGLWLISWISVTIGNRLRPWRCQQCHWHKPILDPANRQTKERAPVEPEDRSADSSMRSP